MILSKGQVCTFIIHITADMGDNYLSKTASTILWSVTVSIYCVGGMLGGVSAGYWANKWGRYVHLLYLSQKIRGGGGGGIIICRRQLLQSHGQLVYPSTVLVECWVESL